MLRRRKGGRLLKDDEADHDVNPMDGIGNMADAMLVLAVGMMLALLTNWNVDLAHPSSVQELEDTKTLSQEEMQQVESNEALEELGVVYQDPDTGKFYVRVEE